ncbi:putative oxidoreductase [Meyerozyma sp. JA9]|nr:putative oxidoreductase [Meyerozyma sp. JA9]
MPLDIVASAFLEGPQTIPGWEYIRAYGPTVATVAAAKYYFGGATSGWEREMHGKVFMVTGGTSGMGAYMVDYLARKGAQIVLLVRTTEDPWLTEYVENLRDSTNNFMIYAETCNLADLYSVRKFATHWLDNQPPRRLDGIICCANESMPAGKPRAVSVDGLERQVAVNYVGHFHLLTLLAPSLRVQPPDRDVRVVLTTCSTMAAGAIDQNDLLWQSRRYPSWQPWKVHGSSKLLLGMFAKEYQRQLNRYERPDKSPCNVHINLVNPGLVRTPSTRRQLSLGTVWGLLVYILMFPLWFIFLKSAAQGAQSIIFALCAPVLAQSDTANLVQECKIQPKVRKELVDEELQEKVFQDTEKLIEKLERASAVIRNRNKKDDKKGKDKETRKNKSRSYVAEKPKTESDLDDRLSQLRSSLGMGGTKDALFPGAPTT